MRYLLMQSKTFNNIIEKLQYCIKLEDTTTIMQIILHNHKQIKKVFDNYHDHNFKEEVFFILQYLTSKHLELGKKTKNIFTRIFQSITNINILKDYRSFLINTVIQNTVNENSDNNLSKSVMFTSKPSNSDIFLNKTNNNYQKNSNHITSIISTLNIMISKRTINTNICKPKALENILEILKCDMRSQNVEKVIHTLLTKTTEIYNALYNISDHNDIKLEISNIFQYLHPYISHQKLAEKLYISIFKAIPHLVILEEYHTKLVGDITLIDMDPDLHVAIEILKKIIDERKVIDDKSINYTIPFKYK